MRADDFSSSNQVETVKLDVTEKLVEVGLNATKRQWKLGLHRRFQHAIATSANTYYTHYSLLNESLWFRPDLVTVLPESVSVTERNCLLKFVFFVTYVSTSISEPNQKFGIVPRQTLLAILWEKYKRLEETLGVKFGYIESLPRTPGPVEAAMNQWLLPFAIVFVVLLTTFAKQIMKVRAARAIRDHSRTKSVKLSIRKQKQTEVLRQKLQERRIGLTEESAVLQSVVTIKMPTHREIICESPALRIQLATVNKSVKPLLVSTANFKRSSSTSSRRHRSNFGPPPIPPRTSRPLFMMGQMKK